MTVDVEKDQLSCKRSTVISAIASLKVGNPFPLFLFFGHSLTLQQAPLNESVDTERPPCDIVAVVDRSGSMSGQKLALVKEALSYLITQLKACDRLSVVAFDHRVSHIFGLKRCSEQGRLSMDRSVQTDLHARGGTNIKSGLTFGLDCLKRRSTQNPVAAIMLLTDGQVFSSFFFFFFFVPHS